MSQFVDRALTKQKLLAIAVNKFDDNEVSAGNAQGWNGQKYASSVRVQGINYFFDEHDMLARIDHWMKENSPLWAK